MFGKKKRKRKKNNSSFDEMTGRKQERIQHIKSFQLRKKLQRNNFISFSLPFILAINEKTKPQKKTKSYLTKLEPYWHEKEMKYCFKKKKKLISRNKITKNLSTHETL